MPNDDCIKRSDAIFALCANCDWTENCGQLREPCGEVRRINDIPAADVETVVRCRDCKFAYMTYDGECKYCACFGSKDEYGELDPELYLPGDFFCAFGTRKEDSDAE